MQEPISEAWRRIQTEARQQAMVDPLSGKILKRHILERGSLAEALSSVLTARLGATGFLPSDELEALFLRKYSKYPAILLDAVYDLEAVTTRDPACTSMLEPLLFFKGFQAIQAHRAAHQLWKGGNLFLAKLLQSVVSQALGVDIHPAAKIGHGIMVDHATNLVVGETARIGNDVSLLHGVTLGGTGKDRGDRHPKISEGVMIGAHAQLLGNIRIGRGAKIGAGAVVLEDVPPHTTVAGVPAVRVGKPGEDMPSLSMDQGFI